MARRIPGASAEPMSAGTRSIARIPGVARGLAAAGLLLAGAVGHAQAQSCPAGSFNPFAAYDNQNPSQTVVANNVVMVGSSRLQLTHTTAGSASINTNAINDQHVTGQIGVRLGHGGNANSASNYIESTYAFRNPANLSQYLPVSGLVFSLHDVDAGDNVIVNAYPAGSSTPVSLTGTSIYSLDTSSGATVVSYAGSNRFSSQLVDVGNRRGTINLKFAGYNIDRVVVRYYDTADAGTYTTAGFLACNASLTLNKTTSGGFGGPFGFTLTNTSRNTGSTVSTAAANTPTPVDGNAGTTGVQPFGITNASTAVTIAESSLPAGWSLTNATCSNAAGTTVGSFASGTYTIPGASIGPSAALTCTFTNTPTMLRLRKTLPNGRVLGTDQFTLSIAGTGAPAAVTTTGSGSTATGTVTHTAATAGSSYTLSESAAGTTVLTNYATTYSCTNARAGGQTPSGNGTSFTVTPVAGDDLTCTFANVAPASPPLTCDATLYLSQADQLYTVARTSNPFTYPPLGPVGNPFNAVGYNPRDNYLYALRNAGANAASAELYRVGGDGVQVLLGTVSGLPTTGSYFSGAFTASNDDNLYVMDGANDNRWYRINVSTRVATALTLSRSLYVADFDYANGLFYGVETNTGQLVSINPTTGAVADLGSPGPSGAIGAFWADSNGLYGALNGGGFYRYDPASGQRTLISNSPATNSNDGARCPLGPALSFNADLAITKTDGATTYAPGANVVYTIVASNNGPFGAQNARVQDALPSGITTASWTCVAANGAACRTASGTGAIDARVDLPVGGTATFTLTMAVPTTFTGNLVNTATVTPDVGNVDPVPGNNSATDTNGIRTALTLRKALPNGRLQATDQFTLSIAGTGAPAAVTTTGTGTTATGEVTHTGATAGSSYTLSESAAGTTALANYATTYACTNTRTGGQTPSGNGATFNVTPVAGDNLTCTFSNARRPQLTLIKTVTNDDGGTQVPTAWTLSAAGPTPISGATGSAAVTNAMVNPGTYTLSESALPSGYSATPYSCAINGGLPVSGNSVTLAAGDSAVCRIHNDDTSAPGQPVACGITSHTGGNGSSFAFGPAGVNASATLQNITFDAGSTAGGSINRFVDSTGRAYTTPAGPGRWLLTNSNATTRLTVTFSPAIPAHRIGLAIYDIGTWDATMPNNSEDPAYTPSLTLSLTGGATSSQFVAHQTGPLATLARFTPASGVVTMDSTAYQPGIERTWRQSVFLRGNANALVSTLTLTATNIKPGDNIGFGLVAIPSCVTVSKVTEGDVGSFDFTTTNINNWNNTAAASPIALTTTATGTPVSSARHYYAHPVASNGQGTQPVTLSEAIPPSWILSPAQCTDANSSRNGNTGSFGSLVDGTLTIPADRMRFESNITCTFTNTRAAILRLQKALPDGRAAAADQFTLSMTGAGAPAPATTAGTGSTATGAVTHATATPGSAYTLSEAAAGGADLTHYVSSYSCSNARSGGQAPSGSGASFGVTPAAGDDLTCTFSNLRRSTDISILKTVAADPVVSGGQAQFTLVVTNHGPMAADGATVRDPAMVGLDCTTAGLPAPTCSATPGTTCPSPLTAAGLQAGLPVPTFPSGGVVTLGLTCSVTASGTP